MLPKQIYLKKIKLFKCRTQIKGKTIIQKLKFKKKLKIIKKLKKFYFLIQKKLKYFINNFLGNYIIK